jgi:hypothetical protein
MASSDSGEDPGPDYAGPGKYLSYGQKVAMTVPVPVFDGPGA